MAEGEASSGSGGPRAGEGSWELGRASDLAGDRRCAPARPWPLSVGSHLLDVPREPVPCVAVGPSWWRLTCGSEALGVPLVRLGPSC